MQTVRMIILMFLVTACGNDTSTVTLDGIFQSVQEGFLVPVEPTPLVTVVGRNANEFGVSVPTLTAGTQVSFQLSGLPADQALVFQTAGTSIETVLSFPIDTSSATPPRLPILVAGSIGEFINLAQDPAGNININVDTSLGIVAGVISPSFGSSVVSTGGTVSRLQLLQKNVDTEVTYQGPYYFNSAGELVDSGTCPDAECNYIFFDVPEGAYRFQQLSATQEVLAQQDVVVLASQMTFGME